MTIPDCVCMCCADASERLRVGLAPLDGCDCIHCPAEEQCDCLLCTDAMFWPLVAPVAKGLSRG